MILTNTQIVEALKVIKTVCQDEANDCPVCPLGKEDGTCMVLRSVPDSWLINFEIPKEWRAFK